MATLFVIGNNDVFLPRLFEAQFPDESVQICVPDGGKAVDIIENPANKINLVISGYHEVDDWKILAQAAQEKGIPLLTVTGYRPEDVQVLIESFGAKYLGKPFNEGVDSFFEAVRELKPGMREC